MNNDCFSNAKEWLLMHGINTEGKGFDDRVKPGVSNVSCQLSRKNNTSATSSTAKLKAAAERAAVLACVKILKVKHAIEEEEERLRRRKEMFGLEAGN